MITVILDGWPSNWNEPPRELTPYFDLRDLLSVDNDVILKGQRVFIPTTLRSEIKNKLHSTHVAYDSMMRRAREAVFWPGMAGEIKLLADSCETCQVMKPANQKGDIDAPQPIKFTTVGESRLRLDGNLRASLPDHS